MCREFNQKMWSRPNVVIQLNYQSEICTDTMVIRVVEFSKGEYKISLAFINVDGCIYKEITYLSDNQL